MAQGSRQARGGDRLTIDVAVVRGRVVAELNAPEVGASDERGAEVTDRMVTIGDLHATIYKAFGIDWTKTYDTPIGRPIKIANSIDDKTGQPIKEII